jgi:hypothetical protein
MNSKKAKKLKKLSKIKLKNENGDEINWTYETWKKVYSGMKRHGDQLIIDLSIDKEKRI